MELITGENDKGRRLDRILRKALPNLPLALIHRLLRQRQVLVNEKPAKAQDRVDSGDKINIHIEERGNAHNLSSAPLRLFKKRPAFYLDILWQDLGLMAVNKPVGIEVHGKGSLDEMVRDYLMEKLPASLSFKPGSLHRLDKPTSGIVVFSANLEGARLFSLLLHERKVKKTYLAIVEGFLEKEELWEDELVRDKGVKKTFANRRLPENIFHKGRENTKNFKEGKSAITRLAPLKTRSIDGKDYTIVKAEIVTGRTHQIRAQAAAHGYPLAGDRKYGGHRDAGLSGFFLHAWKLEFLDIAIEAPLPDAFQSFADQVFHTVQF